MVQKGDYDSQVVNKGDIGSSSLNVKTPDKTSSMTMVKPKETD